MDPAASAPRLSELVVAFSGAAKAALVARGWRKHSGDIYTLDFGDGTLAWLGLDRASKHLPLRIHPVGGVRHEATMRLCDLLGGGKRYVAATLSEPLAYLGPRVPDLAVGTTTDAHPAAAELVTLVEARALPFAERFRDPERQLDALRRREHLAVPSSAIIRRPAMLAVLGRRDEALAALDEELATLGERADQAAQHNRSLGTALRAWIRDA